MTKPKNWNDSEMENKRLVRIVFEKLGGNKSKLSIKKIDYALEVSHVEFSEPIIITRAIFDDNNIREIEKLLNRFLKIKTRPRHQK